jgi:hypothetical protein
LKGAHQAISSYAKCLIETLFRSHAKVTLSNILVRFSEVASCNWFDSINADEGLVAENVSSLKEK